MLASEFQSIRNFHETWAWVVVVANGIAGAWALGAHWLTALRGRALWWYTALAQITIAVQVTLGAVLVGQYDVPLPQMHAFYGFVALISVAIIYSYRAQLKHRLYLLYGLGGLFVMGLAIRAMLLHR